MLAFLFKREREALAEREAALMSREASLTSEVNRRVATTLAQMDPFEPLLKEFHGIFSQTHERVEDPLDAFGQLAMRVWAYQNADNPAFKRMTEWIMNTQGNETLKNAAVTPERILYGRAQISGMVLFIREVKRLAEAYKDELASGRLEDFDRSSPIGDD